MGTPPTTPGSPEATAEPRAVPAVSVPALRTTHQCTPPPRRGRTLQQKHAPVETRAPARTCTRRDVCAHGRNAYTSRNPEMRACTHTYRYTKMCACTTQCTRTDMRAMEKCTRRDMGTPANAPLRRSVGTCSSEAVWPRGPGDPHAWLLTPMLLLLCRVSLSKILPTLRPGFQNFRQQSVQ